MAVGAWSHDRTRHRPICPNGATHTSPGHRPGNCRIQENQCVLKEHRIGRGGAGSRSETRDYAAFLQNACFFFRGAPQGLHPGLVCDAPLGHGIRNTVDEPCIATAVWAWDSKHGGRARYRNRGQGMGFETRWTSRVSEMPLVPDIGNANVPFAPTGRVCGLLNQGGRIRPEGGGGWGADPADPERFAGDFDKTPFFP